MKAVIAVILGALFSACYNYLLRRNTDQAKSFVFWAFLFATLAALLIEGSNLLTFSWIIATLGVIGGFFVMLIFYGLPKAFQEGPSGLTIGIFQSACIIPPLIMNLIFGCECGFTYTLFHAAGGVLVAVGFLWSALKSSKGPLSMKWAFYTGLIFVAQIVALLMYQYKTLIVKESMLEHSLIPNIDPSLKTTGWFLPILFFVVTACMFRGASFGKKIMFQGMAGSFFHTVSAFFLLVGIAWATPTFASLVIPINAVATIIFCNIWSQKIYKERVHWLGTLLALIGIFISFIPG